jgi:dehydrogenase/reductase SDR family protein 1
LERRLKGMVALVTGASRGVGKGVALALGEAGGLVYVTGRTVTEGSGREGLPGSVSSTAADIRARGGEAIEVVCDHRSNDQTTDVYERIDSDGRQLDVLVNNVWGGYEHLVADGRHVDSIPFWEQRIDRWESMFDAGVRPHYVCSVLAARRMAPRGRGLIVTISYWAARKTMGSPVYGAAKAADDALTRDMAVSLRKHGVAVVGLYPGLVRTEYVMRFAEHLDLTNSESPEFTGRAVAALAADPDVMSRSGQTLVVADLAREYGYTDIDGTQPRPLTLESV